MKKYIIVTWPKSQQFMEHTRFNECYLVQAIEGQEALAAAYFVPEDLYNEILITKVEVPNKL